MSRQQRGQILPHQTTSGLRWYRISSNPEIMLLMVRSKQKHKKRAHSIFKSGKLYLLGVKSLWNNLMCCGRLTMAAVHLYSDSCFATIRPNM